MVGNFRHRLARSICYAYIFTRSHIYTFCPSAFLTRSLSILTIEACVSGGLTMLANCAAGFCSLGKAYFDCMGCGLGSLGCFSVVTYFAGPKKF